MRPAFLLAIFVATLCFAAPVAAEIGLTIDAQPREVHAGDVVTLRGTVTGINTIAVYLFLTGPDLDTRGVTLENLNIPAGRGLFTTSPVNMSDGSWTYVWDTSVILGNLQPGEYTVYAVASPVDRLRFQKGEYATVDITILPAREPTPEIPLDPMVPVIAVGLAGLLAVGIAVIKRKQY